MKPFWKAYGTMDEFIKAMLLRMKEIGISQDIIPDTDDTYNIGSATREIHRIYVDDRAYIDVLLAETRAEINALWLTNVVSKTGAYTVNQHDAVVLVNSTAGAFTLTLPAAADAEGQVLIIKKTDAAANAVTIDPDGAELIDGAANNAEIDAQYDCLMLISDGTGWHIIGRWIH